MIFLFTPLIKLFNFAAGLLMLFFGVKQNEQLYVTEEEIRMMVSVGAEEGVVASNEKEMINSIFAFREMVVREVMTPRIDITAVPSTATIANVTKVFKESNYSRLPVYDGTIDNIIGIINAKDIFYCPEGIKSGLKIRSFIRKAHYVPEGKSVVDLLKEFQQLKIHIAIVVDEYGGTAGLVTIEDLLEEIVGQIQDEYDEEEVMFTKVDERTFLVDARMNMLDVNRIINLVLPMEVEYDTIGGFVVAKLDKIPVKGECFDFCNTKFVVEGINGRKITKIKIIVEQILQESEESTPA